MLQISACPVCKTTAKIEVLGKTADNAVSAQNIQAGTADARNEIDDEETDFENDDDNGKEESRWWCGEQSYCDRFVDSWKYPLDFTVINHKLRA